MCKPDYDWYTIEKSMKAQSFTAIAVFIFSFCFSFFLMTHSLSYDTQLHVIRMGSKLWSDFGSHIPLVRSFSLGDNLNRFFRGQAPEYPGFPGEPIRYHFGFYMIAGILEKLGVRIDWAINIPSIIGFTLMLFLTFVMARKFFQSQATAILSLIFLLFNGTLSVLTFLKTHPLNSQFINAVITTRNFPVFGPWDGGLITAFWHLNIYTNQRHLSLSYGVTLLLIYLVLTMSAKPLIRTKILLALGISLLMDLLLFINLPAAAIAGIFLLWFFLLDNRIKLPLVLAGLGSLPWLLFMKHISAPSILFLVKPGYLTHSPLTPLTFLQFWFANLGLHLLLIPIGMILAPKEVRKLLIIPLLILFILPNIFQFSPDMINNHKFFNFFIIIGNMFSAYTIMRLMGLLSRMRPMIFRAILYLIPVALFLCLTASGIIDFFAVVNDTIGGVNDYQSNPDATWILLHSSPDAVFLNSTWFYHPANLAGRSIFSGYPYFTWSYGYDKDKRENIARSIFGAPNPGQACQILRANHISFVDLNNHPDQFFTPNTILWDTYFHPSYQTAENRIYDVKTICQMY
jgi:hypothetical protein